MSKLGISFLLVISLSGIVHSRTRSDNANRSGSSSGGLEEGGGGSGSSGSDNDPIAKLLGSRISSAFMVRLPGCTGTLIAPDWVLTAAHCYGSIRDGNKNENGDFVIDVSEGHKYSVVEKPTASSIKVRDLWTKAVSKEERRRRRSRNMTNEEEEDANVIVGRQGRFWRKAEKIILHGKFEGEALSWKGFDFVLIKLQSGNGTKLKGTVAPICLASKSFQDLNDRDTFMSGYGRRYIPHCLTDEVGPAAFDVCGRPHACAKDHRARNCGLQFLYNGTKHEQCLKTETPSAADPECVALHKSDPKSEEKVSHVFSSEDSSYVTTCYPRQPPSSSKGWCTTRSPGVDEDSEPTFTSGWGFCSDDASQDHCTSTIPEKTNTSSNPVSVLNEEFCKDKLEANLKVEQPETKRSEYAKLQDEFGVVCIGQNVSRHPERDLFYRKEASSSYKSVDPDEAMLTATSEKRNNGSKYLINGGPSCFGDSGGPLFKMAVDGDSGKAVPVLVGVFSFMLWGTCQGEAEPGYYGRLTHALEWLNKYVESDSMCWYGEKFTDAKNV